MGFKSPPVREDSSSSAAAPLEGYEPPLYVARDGLGPVSKAGATAFDSLAACLTDTSDKDAQLV